MSSRIFHCDHCGKELIEDEDEVIENIEIVGPGFDDVVKEFLCYDCYQETLDPEAFVEL